MLDAASRSPAAAGRPRPGRSRRPGARRTRARATTGTVWRSSTAARSATTRRPAGRPRRRQRRAQVARVRPGRCGWARAVRVASTRPRSRVVARPRLGARARTASDAPAGSSAPRAAPQPAVGIERSDPAQLALAVLEHLRPTRLQRLPGDGDIGGELRAPRVATLLAARQLARTAARPHSGIGDQLSWRSVALHLARLPGQP